jgi:hypothetical protein
MTVEEAIQAVPVNLDNYVEVGSAIKQASMQNGMFCEFGVQHGRYTREFAKLIAPKTYYGFDSFLGLPEEWRTAAGHVRVPKGGLACDPPTDLPDNVQLIIGYFQETLIPFIQAYGPLAFAHFDADLYSSTKFCLMALVGNYCNPAYLVFDEITRDDWCKEHEGKAFQEFVDETGCQWSVIGRHKRDGAIFRISGV